MRIAVYPFNLECMAFSEFKDLLDADYCLSEAASPRCWGFAGKDIETVDGPEKIKKSPKEFTKENDILLIPDFTIEPDAAKSLIKEIVSYIPHVRKVICCAYFIDEQLDEIKEACKKAGAEFIYLLDFSAAEEEFSYYKTAGINEEFAIKNRNDKVLKEVVEINAPICAVSGEWEATGKFPIELKLLRCLRAQGYKVSMVGSNFCSLFFGVHRFPDFMLSGAVDETEKPYVFSRFLSQIVLNEAPDIMIVGVPGAMQRFNDQETNRFGVLPYITFQAMKPDYMVLAALYRENGKFAIEELINKCRYCYGVKPDTIHMSNEELERSDVFVDCVDTDHVNIDMVNSVIANEYADADGLVVNLMADGCDSIVTERLISKLSGASAASDQ